MDASTTSPSTPLLPRQKQRTTVLCGCFGSGERRGSGEVARTKWRRRVAGGDFRYDPLSYALNFDDGDDNASDESDEATYRYRNFSSRLPPSPAPAQPHRAIAIA